MRYSGMTTLGIAITTFNHSRMMAAQVKARRRRTSGSFHLVVCDDGSTDDTVATLRGEDVTVITGPRRGIAWNKNRGSFFSSPGVMTGRCKRFDKKSTELPERGCRGSRVRQP
jgi:glycosyl transferase family 2